MRRDSAEAWRRFQERVTELGGQVIEPVYLGTKVPHRVVCSAGHQVAPRPGDVNRGIGLCRTCVGKDQEAAWHLFCQLVAERGGEVLEPKSLGANTLHRVRCSEGHKTRAAPSYVRVGGGICHVCSPTSTISAERRFRDLVAALGGRILEPVWLGNKKPHRVICSQGHETAPMPNTVQRNRSLCRVCSGHDSPTSWSAFQAHVAKQGGNAIETTWLGNKKPHRVVCKEGHECAVLPNNVQQGSGICRTCAYKVWDVFYIVANDTDQTLKFGITSHDARSRLRHHRADGFHRTLKTITGMVDAQALERTILTSLKSAGLQPVRGREYYGIAALPAILDIVDAWGSAAA